MTTHLKEIKMPKEMKTMLSGLCVLVVLVGCGATATAAQVTYSWTGTIVLQPPGSPDPWSIGETSKPYTLTAMVEQSAVDSAPGVVAAHFDLLALEFTIPGVPFPAISIDGLKLEFMDGYLGPRGGDFISIAFSAEYNGHTENFRGSALLPHDTFSFLQSAEQPPVFGSVNSSVLIGHFLMQYTSTTESGVQVTSIVVPEPSTYALAATAILALACARRRKS